MGQEQETLPVNIRRSNRSPLARAWAVDAKGNIRTLYYHGNVSGGALHMTQQIIGDRVMSVSKVRISDALEKEGWVLLKDLYAQEGRLEDWETFLEYQSIALTAESIEALEDAYLPDEVLRRRGVATTPLMPKLRRPMRERMAAAEEKTTKEKK